jgi:hypothetical protein
MLRPAIRSGFNFSAERLNDPSELPVSTPRSRSHPKRRKTNALPGDMKSDSGMVTEGWLCGVVWRQ